MAERSDKHADYGAMFRQRAGAYIRGLRVRLGLTQAQLAKLIGEMQHTAISSIEVGRIPVPVERYTGLADALGVDYHTFAKKMIETTNPWAYAMLWGTEGTDLAELIENMPTRVLPARKER